MDNKYLRISLDKKQQKNSFKRSFYLDDIFIGDIEGDQELEYLIDDENEHTLQLKDFLKISLTKVSAGDTVIISHHTFLIFSCILLFSILCFAFIIFQYYWAVLVALVSLVAIYALLGKFFYKIKVKKASQQTKE